jgi:hypothetical protein
MAVCLLFIACGTTTDRAKLCSDFFEPYADLISGQLSDGRNEGYLAAMAHYREGRYAEAEAGLSAYMESRRDFQKSAYLYLAVSQLALGRPFDAELTIDKLEHSSVKGFADQCAWYTVLCLVCSEQWSRGLAEAQAIAASPRHTYRKQAAELAKRLERAGTE